MAFQTPAMRASLRRGTLGFPNVPVRGVAWGSQRWRLLTRGVEERVAFTEVWLVTGKVATKEARRNRGDELLYSR